MATIQKACVFGILALVGFSASAMPVGVRMAMLGRAAVAASAADLAFPELDAQATPANVAEALAGATDEALAENITDAGSYSEFRIWATSVGAATVKASATAWMSYALGLAELAPVPQDGDLKIDTAQVGADGKLEAVFSLDGVYVNQAALEERLKTVFGVEGAGSLDKTQFSSENIVLALEPTNDGRIRAIVTPPPDADDEFFMLIRVK